MKLATSDNKGITGARNYYGAYTLIFTLTAFLVYLPFILNGKSFVFCDVGGGGDGLVQHFNSFVYYGKFLRGIIRNLIYNHQLVIPMFDLSIGYGQDIVKTLSYYVIGDPFSFLSVFIPVKHAELGYSLLIILRLYLAGIAFSAYARRRRCRDAFVLAGALIYAFSSYTIYIGVLHPYFINPMVFLPLICIGADKVLEGKSPVTFVVSIAIAGLSNFYFFYMLVLLTILYVVFRYFEIREDKSLRALGEMIGRFLLYGLVGALMAGVLLIPSVLGVLNASRVTVENHIPILYNKDYYERLIGGFLAYMAPHYSYMGYGPVGIFGVLILILKARKSRENKFLAAGLLMLVVFLFIPFAGHVFNGFSYVVNRWIWALAFLVAFIASKELSELDDMSPSERKWFRIFIGLFGMGCYISIFNRNIHMYVAVLLLIFGSVLFDIFTRKNMKRYLAGVCIVLAILSSAINAFFIYMPSQRNYLDNFQNAGTAQWTLKQKSPGALLQDIQDRDVFRYDSPHISLDRALRNSSMQLGEYSTAYYFSTVDPYMNKFYEENRINFPMEQTYSDLNYRSMLLALVGAKYSSVIKDDTSAVPYGYDELVSENDYFRLYKTNDYLRFGFTTDKWISRQTYETLSAIEKQQVLMDGIVMEEAFDAADVFTSTFQEIKDFSFTDKELNYSFVESDGARLNDNIFYAENQGDTIELQFDEVSGSELYLLFEGVDYSNPYDESRTQGIIDLTSGENKTWTSVKCSRDRYYSGRHNFLVCLNYSEKPRKNITFSFKYPGEYKFDNISVISQPLDGFKEKVSAFNEYSLKDVKVEPNTISGTLDIPDDRILCLQVPYSEGWKCFVDGVETEIHVGDVAFMAVHVSKGSHSIEFKYRTPYYGLYLAISLISTIGFIIWYNIWVKKRLKGNI